VQMVNDLMDIYDMDPENMLLGRETLTEWSVAYKRREWEPYCGTTGNDLYSDRSIITTNDGANPKTTGSVTHQQQHEQQKQEDGNRKLNAAETLQHTVAVMIICSQKLLEAIDEDMYPDEGTEKIFGIEMEGPSSGRIIMQDLHKGRLIYSVWTEIYKYVMQRDTGFTGDIHAYRRAKQALIDEMTNAIMDERLGEQFQLWTEELLQSDFPLRTYSTEMARRGFDGREYVNADMEMCRGWVNRIRINKANARG